MIPRTIHPIAHNTSPYPHNGINPQHISQPRPQSPSVPIFKCGKKGKINRHCLSPPSDRYIVRRKVSEGTSDVHSIHTFISNHEQELLESFDD